MALKVIDGKVYDVMEVDEADVKAKLEAKVAHAAELKAKHDELEAAINATKAQFDGQIAPYAKQIEGLNSLIKSIEEKRDAAVAEKAKELEALAADMEKANAEIDADKEIINMLLPKQEEEKNVL